MPDGEVIARLGGIPGDPYPNSPIRLPDRPETSRTKNVGSPTHPTSQVIVKSFEPENGDPPLRVEDLRHLKLDFATRTNFFTILWIEKGEGTLAADLQSHAISAPSLWFLNPYQTLKLTSNDLPTGLSLQFHANFFCIETHHHEVGCNGVLFNNPYRDPQVLLGKEQEDEFRSLLDGISQEMGKAELASSEMIVSLLKILMIKATRLKKMSMNEEALPALSPAPEVLDRLVKLIEAKYTIEHRPAFYAEHLSKTPKSLGKLTKRHLGLTVSEMIQNRVLNHAKWQLLHTLRPVKEIAVEVGYEDEYYFSRFFKRRTGMAPSGFREYETRIRSGRNLSI